MARPNSTAPVRRLGARARLMAVAVASCYAAAPAWALNAGDLSKVVGDFTASHTGNVDILTLTTASSRTLVEAQKRFNVLSHEKFNIIQPTAASVFLLRVVPQAGVLERSVIDGSIYSNGQFWLQNAAGALISKGAVIDTAGFLATTMAVRHEDFLAGRLTSLGAPGVGSIENKGTIKTSSGGSVYLIGANVTNEGVITTPEGETILAAGQTVNLVDTGTPGVKVEVTGEEGNVTNLGEIVATAGRIGMAGVIVKNSGTLNASSVVSDGGRVFLKASKDTYVDGAGRIVATGTKGGRVEVLGNRVAVMDQAQIDASGAYGGGTVLVGGDYQGKNAAVQNAAVTYFGPQAKIKADAIVNGNGGKVILWADDTTRAYGNISARGGSFGGNGGFVETSGYRYLSVSGARVDTRASLGQTGSWLLDPMNVSIITGAGDPIAVSPFVPSGGTTSTISAADLSTFLGTSALTIRTDGSGSGSGNITITNANITGANSLLLLAYGGLGGTGNINISGSNIQLSAGNLEMVAGWSGNLVTLTETLSGTGDISITGSTINIQAGSIDFRAGRDISVDAGSTRTSVQASNALSFAARNIYATGGATSSNTMQGSGVFVYGGSMTLSADTTSGEIVLQGGTASNTIYGGQYSYGGSVIFQSGGNQTVTANKVRLVAGASGHDNAAVLEAYGSQAITVYGGGLSLKGGGSASSYNNSANIAQRGPAGSQSVTVFGGGSVTLEGGAGTGTGGYYDDKCGTPCAGNSSHNQAEISNKGTGNQTFDFIDGGAIALYGGSAGTSNNASIDNHAASLQKIWSSTLDAAKYPTIYVQGGSGGAVVYGGSSFGGTGINKYYHLENGAGISSGETGANGNQLIYAKGITLVGGGNGTTIGGAYLGAEGAQTIVSYGSVTLTGGAGNTVTGADFSAPAAIGSEEDANITLAVYGGNLTLAGGSGNGSPVLIGSLHYGASVDIGVYGGDVVMTGNAGGVAAGSYRKAGEAGTPIDTSVRLATEGNITVSGSNVRVGAFAGQLAAVGVSMVAGKNITVTGAKVGTDGSPGTGTIDIKAGMNMSGTGGSAYGGNLSLAGATVYGNTVNLQAYGGASSAGILTLGSASSVYGNNVNLTAASNVALNGILHATGILGVNAGYYDTAYTQRTVNGGNISMDAGAVAYGGTSLSFRASAGSAFNAGAGTIGLGRVESPGIQIVADRQIFDNNGPGVANVVGQSISLSSNYGGTANTLAISADVQLMSAGPPPPTVNASVSATATYGGISIRNVGAAAPNSVMLADHSTYAGSGQIFYSSLYDINMATSSFSLTSHYGGITVWSGGFLTLGGGASFAPNATYGNVFAWGQTGVATGANMSPGTAIDLNIGTAGSMTIGHGIGNVRNLGLYAAGNLDFLSGSSVDATANVYMGGAASALAGAAASSTYGGGTVTLNNAYVKATNGTIVAYSGGDIRLNNGSYLEAGYDVNLGLGGASSTVYLNDAAGYANPSYVLAGSGNTGRSVNIGLPGRTADGVVIDGSTTMASTPGGSGLFVGNRSTPAVKGAGLNVVYGVAASAAITGVVNEVVNSINTTTAAQANTDTQTPTGTLTTLLPPSGGGTSSLASLATGTVGGGTGEFGGSTSSTSGSGTTSGATTGTSPTESGSSTASSSSGTSGETSQSSGDQSSGSKDSKDEKKEDKKDDKAKKADSGEKKDDKSNKQAVGKCSA